MTGVLVRLTWPEVDLCIEVARQRVIENLQSGAREEHGTETELGGIEYNFRGCLGECATAKYFGLFWSGNVGNKGLPDVGRNIEVRATPGTHLRLHKKDKDHRPYVLAIARTEYLPRVTLRGWMYGRDAKQERHWKDIARNGRPAYFVEGTCPPLRPMSELIYHP